MSSDNSIYHSPAGAQAVMALYDNALAHWPIPFETRQIPTRYGKTFVLTCGNPAGAPLVLLQGAGTNSAIWAGDVAEYGRQHRVYAIDLLGEPGKSAPNRPAWDSPAYGDWLAEVLAALDLVQVTLLGISQGGWTALQLAVSRPGRVARLVLLCPGGIVPDRLSFVLRAVPLSLLGSWGTRRLVRLLYGDQPVPEGVEEILVVVTRSFKARMGVLPLFSDAELQQLTMPTLLLAGTKDALRDSARIAARLAQHLPQLTVTLLPGAGHALVDPAGEVLDFLAATAEVVTGCFYQPPGSAWLAA